MQRGSHLKRLERFTAGETKLALAQNRVIRLDAGPCLRIRYALTEDVITECSPASTHRDPRSWKASSVLPYQEEAAVTQVLGKGSAVQAG